MTLVHYFGCHNRVGKRFRLTYTYRGRRAVMRTPRLAGRFAAYSIPALFVEGEELLPAYVRVVDLRGGRKLRLQGAVGSPADGPGSAVTDLELATTGAVAWIASYFRNGTRVYEVRKSEPENGLLDSGTDIEPRSLAVSESTVYWTKAGVPRSAALR